MKADDKQPFVALILCFCDHRNGARNSVCYLTKMKFVLHLLGVIRARKDRAQLSKNTFAETTNSPSFLPRNTQARKCACAGESCRKTHEHAKMSANTLYFGVATNFSTCLFCSPQLLLRQEGQITV